MVRGKTRRYLSGVSAALAGVALFGMSACYEAVPEVTVVQPAPPGTAVVVPAETHLSTSNAAALVLAANNATIQRADIARSRASNAQVRSFAERVYLESQAADAALQALIADFDITPQADETSNRVSTIAARTVSYMQSARGLEVDRIFLEAQSANDRWLVGTLNAIIPTLPDVGARDDLEFVRNALTARLMEAERLHEMVIQRGARG
ncbi:MAG TPA: DUF4142 domain-containing protein [Longimicrobiales bacterium]|nr:DUF4142 domain-containing protein [Longimicrobiales bacterium]